MRYKRHNIDNYGLTPQFIHFPIIPFCVARSLKSSGQQIGNYKQGYGSIDHIQYSFTFNLYTFSRWERISQLIANRLQSKASSIPTNGIQPATDEGRMDEISLILITANYSDIQQALMTPVYLLLFDWLILFDRLTISYNGVKNIYEKNNNNTEMHYGLV